MPPVVSKPLDVRKEAWYARYYQTVVAAINNAKRKYPDHTIYLLGIEGDVQYGKRTRQEWTFLQEDIDKHILDRKVHARPSNMRVSFENFPGVVEKFASQPDTYVLVASCPARIGDNHRVMEDVHDITSGKPWSAKVDLVFSSANSAASAEFYNMRVAPLADGSGGGGGGAGAVSAAVLLFILFLFISRIDGWKEGWGERNTSTLLPVFFTHGAFSRT